MLIYGKYGGCNMSFGIVRVQKMGSGTVKGIEIHDRREKEGISHTNKDIDWEQTSQNYDLHPKQNQNFTKTVKERIAKLNLPKAVRKDAVVMAQVLVTSDHDFFKGLSKEQQEQFFKDSYNFLSERYGKENVISATVHLDERTPHMHFNFVPVTADGRLSAKSVLTRQNLIQQQTAFQEQVGKHYGLERGIQGGKKKHLEIAELKAQTALETASKAQERVQAIENSIKPLQAEYEAKKAYIAECDKASEVSMMYPTYAEQKKSLFGKETVTVPKDKWEQKHISASEKGCLKKATKKFEEKVMDFSRSSSAEYVRGLELKVSNLEHDLLLIKAENSNLKTKNKCLEKDLQRSEKQMIERMEKILGKIPVDIAKSFVNAWNQDVISSRNQDRNISR